LDWGNIWHTCAWWHGTPLVQRQWISEPCRNGPRFGTTAHHAIRHSKPWLRWVFVVGCVVGGHPGKECGENRVSRENRCNLGFTIFRSPCHATPWLSSVFTTFRWPGCAITTLGTYMVPFATVKKFTIIQMGPLGLLTWVLCEQMDL
jgi:hypothetical protein